nr:GNAT family N-acetyltransferase [Tessaracoccus sp. OS52]
MIRLVASDVARPQGVGDSVGIATIGLPQKDNRDIADLSVAVRRERRGEGIGAALFETALRVAQEHARTKLFAFTLEPWNPPPGARLLEARTGEGAIDAAGRESVFLTERGFELNQVERISRLTLPAEDDLVRLRDEVKARTSADYECITVPGPTPEEFLEDAVALRVAMSTDVPMGEVEVEPEAWDTGMIRVRDADLELADREQLQTFVRHVPTGRLVGFTRLFRDRGVEHLAHQWETLVVSAHRGHGLGLLCKATNHAAIPGQWPGVRQLSTGNASENRHMLAINAALGYEPDFKVGFWVAQP